MQLLIDFSQTSIREPVSDLDADCNRVQETATAESEVSVRNYLQIISTSKEKHGIMLLLDRFFTYYGNDVFHLNQLCSTLREFKLVDPLSVFATISNYKEKNAARLRKAGPYAIFLQSISLVLSDIDVRNGRGLVKLSSILFEAEAKGTFGVPGSVASEERMLSFKFSGLKQICRGELTKTKL